MSALTRWLGIDAMAAATAPAPVGTVATSEGALRSLDPVAAAAFGIPTEGGAVTRAEAMRVPGIKRGRNLIAGTIGTLPLVCTNASGQLVPNYLLTTLDPRTTVAYTLAWTVDDLLFRGVSWWRVLSRYATGFPATVERLVPERVTVLPATASSFARVLVDGHEADDRDIIRFDALDEGILTDGAVVVRLALALLRAGQRVADDDWAGMILRLAEGATELSNQPNSAEDGTGRSQVQVLLDALDAAIRTRTIPYFNRAVEIENVGVNAQQRQLTELGELVASETARLLNLPASRIGAPQGSGMTYTNTESDRRDLVDTTLALFMAPVAQRLSMPDVTPIGQRVTFDLTAYLRGTTTELVTAGVAAIDAGLTDAPEVRHLWLGMPPRDDLPARPAPAPAPAPREDPAA